ncbi:MAG TPA: NYN domain-containing protein [Candidatus Absconditabacterales bacterium]|nr:NYN domain-containing protein [Candidatus Absconditabacterales bacterium]
MNIVYIDVQNTHKATQKLGWLIDWKKFFIYLKDKGRANTIYYAVGYISENQGWYDTLSAIGYTMLYKETIRLPNGETKGNVDIDIAIKVLLDFYEGGLTKTYLITNDGDYNTLIKMCQQKGIRGKLFTPDIHTASTLLKKIDNPIDINDIKHKIQKNLPNIGKFFANMPLQTHESVTTYLLLTPKSIMKSIKNVNEFIGSRMGLKADQENSTKPIIFSIKLGKSTTKHHLRSQLSNKVERITTSYFCLSMIMPRPEFV